MGCGSKACGCMSARRRRSRRPRPRSWQARPERTLVLQARRSQHRDLYDRVHGRRSPPRVFTIPASAPFLPTLIARVDGRAGWSRLSRSGRSAGARRGDALSADAARLPAGARRLSRSCSERDAAILPRIVPIGDVDEDEIAFAEAATGAIAADALDLPGRARRPRAHDAAGAADPEMGGRHRAADRAARRWSPTARPRRSRSPTIWRG